MTAPPYRGSYVITRTCGAGGVERDRGDILNGASNGAAAVVGAAILARRGPVVAACGVGMRDAVALWTMTNTQTQATAAMVAAFATREEAMAALLAAYPSRSLPGDLAAFAHVVLDAVKRTASASPDGGPCRREVFISDVLATLVADGYTVDADATKARLVDAHRASLVCLSRCDIACAFDYAKQAASETRYMVATWHFIRG